VRSIYTGVIEGNQLTNVSKIRANSNYDYYLPSIIPGTDILVFLQLRTDAHSTQLIRYDMDKRQEQIISRSYKALNPRVSSDGKWIFFTFVRDDKSLVLRVSTADWSIAEVPVNFADIDGSIAISPDNQWLIFSVKQEDNTDDLYRLSFP
jgi:Tol biopolymer transport system component